MNEAQTKCPPLSAVVEDAVGSAVAVGGGSLHDHGVDDFEPMAHALDPQLLERLLEG